MKHMNKVLSNLRAEREQAVLEVGRIDKEINSAMADIPPLKAGDVYSTEPFQDMHDNWVIAYYIIGETQNGLKVEHSTNNGIHTRAWTLHFIVEQDYDPRDQVGFSRQRQHDMKVWNTWEYVGHSSRWTLETDLEHDAPNFLCNLAEDKNTKEWWGFAAEDEATERHPRPAVHASLSEELTAGMNDLHMPPYVADDEVRVLVDLKLQPEIYCLRLWAITQLSKGHDGLPDHLFVKGGVAQPFRWYRSSGPNRDLGGRYILTEDGWLDYDLETGFSEEMNDAEFDEWTNGLELIEYEK